MTPMSDERDERRLDLEVEETRQRGDGAVGVERAQQQVAGLRGAEGHLRRLLVANLADHDDLRVVAKERRGDSGERVADVVVDLGLAQLVVDVLDRDPRR